MAAASQTTATAKIRSQRALLCSRSCHRAGPASRFAPATACSGSPVCGGLFSAPGSRLLVSAIHQLIRLRSGPEAVDGKGMTHPS